METKYKFGMFVIGTVALLQCCAWVTGKNGVVFAFTGTLIGAVAGSILGFQFGKKNIMH